LRHDAPATADANLPRRNANPGEPAVPAASAAATTASGGLPERNHGPGRHELPAAASAAPDGSAVPGTGRRTRL